MADLLATATEAFKAGQWDVAALMYEKCLEQDPSNAGALHSLGLIHNQRGQYQEALEKISKAAALRPNAAVFYVNLGEAYRNLGDPRRAAGCCVTALRLRPNFPEAMCTLGLSLHESGHREEAVEQFLQALALRPDMASAHNNLGLVLQELNRLDEAIPHFRRAIELAPELYRARTNLGMALLLRGHSDEAISQFQQAARLSPDLPILRQNLGNAFRTVARYADARAAYQEALWLEPDNASLHYHMGLTLKGEGKLEEAQTWYKLAVALDANNTFYWQQLAFLYAEREEFAEAISCWERVIELSPGEQPTAYLGLGMALQEEGRLAEAMERYEAAIQLQPDFAEAYLHIGGVHELLGRMDDAEAAFRNALRLQPDHSLAHARLATLLRDKLPDADLELLEAQLAAANVTPPPRTRMLFALAHVLDAKRQYSRAGDCLRDANALNLDLTRGDRDFAPSDHERHISEMMDVFNREFIERTAGQGLETRRPVFIIGLPRSGTTLIEQVLASHPSVHGAGELRLARKMFESLPTLLDRSERPMLCVPHLDAPAIQRLGRQYLDRLAILDGGLAERIVDKMPDNYMQLGMITTLFPQAVIIHCRRDLRDIAVSCWMTDFRSIRWANDPQHIAARFREYRRIMNYWPTTLQTTIHEVNYEETVSDLEGVGRRLLAACGLEWDPACLEFYRTQRTVRTASVTQVRQPIYKKSVARWKNYEDHLSDLFAEIATIEAEFPAGQNDVCTEDPDTPRPTMSVELAASTNV